MLRKQFAKIFKNEHLKKKVPNFINFVKKLHFYYFNRG